MRMLRTLWRDRQGEDLVELVLTLPILLIVVFGILEFGNVLDAGQSMTGLSREGASIAARGVSLDSVVQVTAANGSNWGLSSRGTVIASRLVVQGGTPMVAEQRTVGGLGALSRVGPDGGLATAWQGGALVDGQTYYVVEVFLPYKPFTPLRGFVSALIPDTLYERALF